MLTLGTSSLDPLDPFRWGSLSSQNGPERPSIRAGYFRSVSLFVQRDLWMLLACVFGVLDRSPEPLLTLSRWSLPFFGKCIYYCDYY